MTKKRARSAPPRFRYRIEALNADHQVKEFDCGEKGMNTFLTAHAHRNKEKGYGATYVLVVQGTTRVLGYYTLVAGHMVRERSLTFREQAELPPYNVPVIRMGRLAVDRSEQGKGAGKRLLIDALRRAEIWSSAGLARGVDVDAIDEKAVAFYLKHNFEQLPDADDHLFITMEKIRQLLLPL